MIPTNSCYHYLPVETQNELKTIAEALVVPGKGILAVDESGGTMGRRFKEIGIENSEENRRTYRQLLFKTENLSEYISGAILFHETLFQKSEDDGTLLIDILKKQNIIPGIKVDKGVVPLYGTEDEYTTQGLDDLGPRCKQYKEFGCQFAKWRCVLRIGNQTPSQKAIEENANILARYASVCQVYRLVPIVEPEIVPNGDHNILKCQQIADKVLSAVFKALNDHRVFLEGILLKTNMVTPGQTCITRVSPQEVGRATLITLHRTVPISLTGVLFLSGGQSEEEASINLNAINQCEGFKPWALTFSFGRALQASVLHAWNGNSENTQMAQEELLKRAKANSAASIGNYVRDETVIGVASNENLFVTNIQEY